MDCGVQNNLLHFASTFLLNAYNIVECLLIKNYLLQFLHRQHLEDSEPLCYYSIVLIGYNVHKLYCGSQKIAYVHSIIESHI